MNSARFVRGWAAALVLVGLLGSTPTGAAAAPAGARVVFRLSDPRIDEASGIGVGIRSPGVLYVQNDSGDSARFFALDRRTGHVLAVYTVPGASNVDWEDLAVGRDARGVPSIWLADTGDNDARRREVRIYRVDEPAVTAGLGSVTGLTSRPDVWRLRYPRGPVNVEALAVAPGGAMTLATKSILGRTDVYAVPSKPDPDTVQTVRPIGTFDVPASDGPFGGGDVLGLLVTGGAISPTGDRFVLRTYTHAYVWALTRGNVAAALPTAPVRVELPSQPQGEGVAFDGTGLLVDSEKAGSAVWSVPIPTGSSTASASAAPGPTASTSAGGAVARTSTPASARGQGGTFAHSRSTTSRLAIGVVAAGLVVGVVLLRWGRGRGDRR